MLEKQRQEAGDNSQQIQASTVIINNGIDEKRAREIVDEKLHEVINGYSQEAHAIAENRINLFADDLIPKLVKVNLLNQLKDPSIQILLVEAQKSAASTERPTDYELLSELLIHRVEEGNDRNVRASVSHAIKIIDEISDEALLGLTAVHAIACLVPITGRIKDGIKTLANIFDKVLYDPLPIGNEWIDNLEVLGAIRINEFGSMKKIDQFYSKKFSGYIDVGIDKTTDDFKKAIVIAKKANLPDDILCDHELRPGYARLKIVSIDMLDLMAKSLKIQFSDDQKQAIKNIYALYSEKTDLKNENIVEFIKLWDKFESLKKLRYWWDSVPVSFTVTSVGQVLAKANAQRCDPTLADFN